LMRSPYYGRGQLPGALVGIPGPAQRIAVKIRISEDLFGEIKRLHIRVPYVCEKALRGEVAKRRRLEAEKTRKRVDPYLPLAYRSD